MHDGAEIEESRKREPDMKGLVDEANFGKEIEECRKREADMMGLVDEANFSKEIEESRKRETDMKGLVDEANFSKEIEGCRKREADMKGLVDEANFNAKLAEQRIDRNEQYSRLWNLKILFISEKPGPAPETPEVSEKEALRMFHELLGLKNITPNQLDAVHRVRERKQNTTRPIIVRIVSGKTRLEL